MFDWAKPACAASLYEHYFQPACKALGLGNVRFYDLRHSGEGVVKPPMCASAVFLHRCVVPSGIAASETPPERHGDMKTLFAVAALGREYLRLREVV